MGTRSVICYAYPAKPKTTRILKPFARGGRGSLVTDLRYRGGPAAFYGLRYEAAACFAEARAGGDWYYIDNAYFGRDQYYRVTRGAFQYLGPPRPDRGRWRRLHIRMQDWRRGGRHVLICLQSKAFHDLVVGTPRDVWLADVQRQLRQHTDRPIVIREKGSATPLAADLADCWAVVTQQSNCALDAICAGVPAFVLGQSAASPLALSDLSQIESPLRRGDRETWAATLAGQQWTLAEFMDGSAWRAMENDGSRR